jgi:hypothetical protein
MLNKSFGFTRVGSERPFEEDVFPCVENFRGPLKMKPIRYELGTIVEVSQEAIRLGSAASDSNS